MGRRRKQTLAGDLVMLPWQASAVLALVAFVAIRWALPAFIRDGSPFAGVKTLVGPLSWIALSGFGALALLSALRARWRKGRARMPASSASASAQARAVPAAWSLEALRSLEWKRFELLCARYYEAQGFETETLAAGPDGGIDVKLFKNDPSRPLAVVQCKAWQGRQVGVKEIRELLGSMVHAGVGRGIFVTTATYSKDALAFGAANPIQLLDGAAFEKKILALPQDQQDALLAFAFEGDYLTPSCPSCGVKMLARDSQRGRFWGCRHYPACKSTLPMRA